MTILYLHGIGSGANSRTATELRKAFPEATILAPELPASPKEAFEFLREEYWCRPEIDLVIGTSLGAFYTLTIPMVKKILVNPALFADEDIREKIGLGPQPFFCERSDGSREYVIDEGFITELKDIRRFIFEENRDTVNPEMLDHNLINETYALFAKYDDIVNHKKDFAELFAASHIEECEGGHRLDIEQIHSVLVSLVRKVLDAECPYAFVTGDGSD